MRPQDPADDEGWSARHDGVRPSPVVRGWLRMVRALAAGPVLRIPPDVLSVTGVLALGAALAAVAGPGWPAVAVPLIAAAGVLDGLDGAVALRTGRARPLGAVVDAMADRLGDLLLGGVLLALGAPPAWVAAALALVFLLEYLRARAQAVGMPGVGTVTVAERPTRLIVVGLAAAGAAAFPAGVPPPGWGWGLLMAVTWTAVGVVGLAQLTVGVRRSMPPEFPPAR
ncbi:CDP-alcohol phosphatidyltransferase family protein [Mycobacterium sp. NPDC050551]|uniref:CDP-alcohol phosphatidyltransferase family protein n=1 Tax=Mycobacterium sp. NPDC050551 TaxID=3155407 RepID=UPI0034131989